jgi:flavin-dependent dehydrogenase
MPITSKRIAIVGGGPAGAFTAAELARGGGEILLFDEKLAWEKPCGGGITPKAIQRWPFLKDMLADRNWITHCELTAPSGRKVIFPLESQIVIFSRLALNGLMLERARDAGVKVSQERIVKIEGAPGNWILSSRSSQYEADFVVLASGARNSFRGQFSRPLGPHDFMVAAGYYVPGTHRTVQIKFLPGLHGYMWVFPRADHFSMGICGRMEGKNSSDLRRIFEREIPELGLSLDGARFYAHIIPALTCESLRVIQLAGDGWAMVGDAAGLVDAITGEGLYYALRSAEILAQSMLDDTPEEYARQAKGEIIPELEIAAAIAERFYCGKWLGGAVIERMVSLTDRSASFRELMRDLFAGTQEYSNLKQRARRSLPRILGETAISAMRRRRDHADPELVRITS